LHKNTINIIIPVYNEGDYIFEVISEISEVKSTFEEDFKLIIVDDCSDDNTSKEPTTRDKNFRFI
jgi:glycosyltransferase involved in cell wall biosynthesis